MVSMRVERSVVPEAELSIRNGTRHSSDPDELSLLTLIERIRDEQMLDVSVHTMLSRLIAAMVIAFLTFRIS